MVQKITSILIHYGNEDEAWEYGELFGNSMITMENTDPEKFNLFMKGGNERWYKLYKKHNKKWPHPGKYILELSKIYDFPMKWIPELNYIILFIPLEIYAPVYKQIKQIIPYIHTEQ